MKKTIVFLILFIKISLCHGQYSKDKLTDILTGGSTKEWTAKTSPEKQYTFNKSGTVETGKGQTEKWVLTSADNIRWFISIGAQKYELIVSYDKSGKQYLKLTNQAGDGKSLIHAETILYPAK